MLDKEAFDKEGKTGKQIVEEAIKGPLLDDYTKTVNKMMVGDIVATAGLKDQASNKIKLLPFHGTDPICELLSRCAGPVLISVNDHRASYEKVADYINEDDLKDIPDNILQAMIQLDTIVKLQFYPHTPVGFYTVYHYSLGLAAKEALTQLENDGIK